MEKHIILTMGRSGSNGLVNLLNQHPNILNAGEVLGPWMPVQRWRDRLRIYREDDEYLDALLEDARLKAILNFGRTIGKFRRGARHEIKRLRDVHTFGFKEFSNHLARPTLRQYLKDRTDIKVVSLTRTNLLDRVVSLEVMRSTGVVLTRVGEDVVDRKVTLNCETLLNTLNLYEEECALLDQMIDDCAQHRLFRTKYEDLYGPSADTQAVLNDIFTFLGVAPHPIEVKTKKTVSKGALSVISNLEDCRAVVAGTRFAPLFV